MTFLKSSKVLFIVPNVSISDSSTSFSIFFSFTNLFLFSLHATYPHLSLTHLPPTHVLSLSLSLSLSHTHTHTHTQTQTPTPTPTNNLSLRTIELGVDELSWNYPPPMFSFAANRPIHRPRGRAELGGGVLPATTARSTILPTESKILLLYNCTRSSVFRSQNRIAAIIYWKDENVLNQISLPKLWWISSLHSGLWKMRILIKVFQRYFC